MGLNSDPTNSLSVGPLSALSGSPFVTSAASGFAPNRTLLRLAQGNTRLAAHARYRNLLHSSGRPALRKPAK